MMVLFVKESTRCISCRGSDTFACACPIRSSFGIRNSCHFAGSPGGSGAQRTNRACSCCHCCSNTRNPRALCSHCGSNPRPSSGGAPYFRLVFSHVNLSMGLLNLLWQPFHSAGLNAGNRINFFHGYM